MGGGADRKSVPVIGGTVEFQNTFIGFNRFIIIPVPPHHRIITERAESHDTVRYFRQAQGFTDDIALQSDQALADLL